MSLFSERLVEDVRRLPGARHTFLSQVCSARGQRYRNALEALVQEAGPLEGRASELLTSLDNRRFFQGYAEVATGVFLLRNGFTLRGVAPPGPLLRVTRGNGPEANVSVLSYIHKSRPAPDRATIRRLVGALNRVGGTERLVVVVHRWLPHDFDTDLVRRAVDRWLSDVEKGLWEGRYASFVDEQQGVHLEFGLTGRQSKRGPRVCLTLGPFLSQVSMMAVENRVLTDLDRYRLGPHAGTPLVLACVADQPWAIGRAWLHDFLYGRPRRTESWRDGDTHGLQLEFDEGAGGSLFRDPLYGDVSAFLWLARDPQDPTVLQARSYLNPWARVPLEAADLPVSPVLAPRPREGRGRVVTWEARGGPRLPLL